MNDTAFERALLKLVKEDFGNHIVEIVSYRDGGYQILDDSGCGEGTCFDEDWVTEVTVKDDNGYQFTEKIIDKLPELIERLTA